MIRYIPSTIRQIGRLRNDCEEIIDKFALKNEDTSVQLEVFLNKKTWVNLDKMVTLPWDGLTDILRIEIDSDVSSKISFEGDVLDDDLTYKKDIILEKRSGYLDRGYNNLWIDLKSDIPGKHIVNTKVYLSNGMEDEKLIYSKSISFEVSSVEMPKENIFYLDLWQHLSSLARKYNCEYFSDEHFRIIENFMKPLAKAGQKVCDLIVSDYSWAGQSCYRIYENKSSLYEYNIIKTYIENGKLKLDFSAFDRYIAICQKLGMCGEIDLFGIIGNWKTSAFDIVLEDFDEPVRVRVYDKDNSKFTFIRTKQMYKQYVTEIFNHLEEMNLWDITRVIGDQPKKVEDVSNSQSLLKEIKEDVKIKYAIMNGDFYKDYKGYTDSFSIILNELIRVENGDLNLSDKSSLKDMTWYVCWTPFNLNQFVRSPLIQSRLVGYMTYLFDMKGFLRWNYCLYTDSDDYRYRQDRWVCGDMYFVYPSKSGNPELSLRMKQLMYGTNDFSFLKLCENKLGRNKVLDIIKDLTGEITELNYDSETRNLIGGFKDDYKLLESVKRKLAKEME